MGNSSNDTQSNKELVELMIKLDTKVSSLKDKISGDIKIILEEKFSSFKEDIENEFSSFKKDIEANISDIQAETRARNYDMQNMMLASSSVPISGDVNTIRAAGRSPRRRVNSFDTLR